MLGLWVDYLKLSEDSSDLVFVRTNELLLKSTAIEVFSPRPLYKNQIEASSNNSSDKMLILTPYKILALGLFFLFCKIEERYFSGAE